MKGKFPWVRVFLVYIIIFALFITGTMIGSNAVAIMAESASLSQRSRIVIDAGHGGEDGGATSCTGVLESTINLDISLRLNDLMHLMGHETVMIRTTDVSVYTQGETIAARKASDLKQRVKIVNETENALLVSIHQNQFSDSRYSGAQVFYAETAGSEELAKSLQANLVASVNPGSNRQAKKSSGVYLMEHIECTGILVECGFLSNVEEEYRLRDAEYQKDLCCVIASSVLAYLRSQ